MDDSSHLPSPKLIWTLLWFWIFGISAWMGMRLWNGQELVGGNNSAETEQTVQAGPLPVVVEEPLIRKLKNEKKQKVEKKEKNIRTAGVKFRDLPIPDQEIEVPSAKSMSDFYDALLNLESSLDNETSEKNIKKRVEILHYGDSILTTDELSGQVRNRLQEHFGDAGHGFVLLGNPWRWYHHLGIDNGAKGKWRMRPFTSNPLKDGLYGLGGVAFQAMRGSHGRAWIGTMDEEDESATVANFEISYLQQPEGGSFELFIGDERIDTISTNGIEKKTAYKQVNVPLGQSKLSIEFNNDGRLRVFGVSLGTGKPGIVYNSLSINGARASTLSRFNREHWISEMKVKNPSLVILMLGTNEGANKYLVIKEYKKHLAEVLNTVKTGLPNTSVLVVGPLDQAKRLPDGGWDSMKMPEKLGVAQREVAFENDCAFFDTWTVMGGRGSMGKWVSRGLGGGDLIHPTKNGARKIGNWLFEALLFGYEKHKKAKLTIEREAQDSEQIPDAGTTDMWSDIAF